MARRGLMRRRSALRSAAVAGALLLPTLAFSIVPIAQLVFTAAADSINAGDLPFRSMRTLGNTVLLAAGAAAGAAALGVPAGLVLGVARWRGRTLLRALLLVPLALPPYFHGIGWFQLLRPNGVVARSLSAVTNCAPATPVSWLQSLPGAITILALAYFPLVAVFAEKALSLAPRSLSEAAMVFGTPRSALFRHVYWPCIRPAVIAGGLIVAVLAASDLGVPTLAGIDVFSFEILTELAAFNNVAEATLLMLPLLALGLLALMLAPPLTSDAGSPESADSFFPLPSYSEGGPARIVRRLTVLMAVVALTPLLAIVWRADDTEAWRAMLPIAGSTLSSTLIYAGTASTISIAIALALGVIVRARRPGTARGAQCAFMIGFVTPGAILGLALTGLYDSPILPDWIGSGGLVVAALLVRFQIVSSYALSTSVAQIPTAAIESASLDGASPIRRMIDIELPLLLVPILAASACLLVLGLAEIAAVILLYPPGGETLMLALYSIEANSPASHVAVLAALYAALVLGLAGIAATVAIAIRAKSAATAQK